jgi:hypothetical protein
VRTLRLTSPNMRGPDVAALQRAINRERTFWGETQIAAEGIYGQQTARAVMDAGYWLGALHSTLAKHEATTGLQRIILHPGSRNWMERKRGRERRAARARKLEGPLLHTLEWAAAKVGISESPPNSNRGPQIDVWQRDFGALGEPWCGFFVAEALKQGAGLILPQGCGYTPNLLAWASAGINGFERLAHWDTRQPGDLVLFKWPGVSGDPCDHVGILRGDNLHTIEGNTSKGDGSQNDGGIVAIRNRGPQFVVGCARPRYKR